MKNKILYILLGLLFTFFSCVSKKKFQNCSNQLQNCTDKEFVNNLQKLELSKNIDLLKHKTFALEEDTTGLNKLIREYELTLKEYERISTLKISENEKLKLMVIKKNSEIVEKEKRINELDSILNTQKSILNEIMFQVKNALIGFNKDEIAIYMKEGKIYVSLSDNLLFSSGSSTLDSKGKNAIGILSNVIKTQKDLELMIIGHTDSIPIKTANIKDNWDLSVQRANSVVRLMIDSYSVNPSQITSAGRSEFAPISTNETKEGQALNRRIEIIILPKLNKLYELILK